MASPEPPPFKSPQPRNFGAHRSFTVPSRLGDARPSSATSKSPEAVIDTLFESPKCKIVSFTPAYQASRSRAVSLGATGTASGPVGELPYGSSTERTIALGPLRVYRVQGSVAFLNSGELVHAVLPKSACWCVDGKTKFVLGVPGKKYYRIELPCDNEEDQAKADDFKIVLAQISQYETTACPFKRGFYVELPEITANTPKRPWKPKHAPGVSSPWSPEGQLLSDGVRIERRFPSPTRGSSQSPRRIYRTVTDNIEPSDSEPISEHTKDDQQINPFLEPRVPRLVATYDEFGATLMQEPERSQSDVKLEPYPFVQENNPILPDLTDTTEQRNESSGQRHPNSTANKFVADTDSKGSDDCYKVPSEVDFGVSEDERSSIASSSQASLLQRQTPPRLEMVDGTDKINWLDQSDHEDTPIALKSVTGMRAVTAPIFSPLRSTIVDVEDAEPQKRSRNDSNVESIRSVESSSSFHSLHSPTSPVQYSPILESSSISPQARDSFSSSASLKIHKRDTSSNTITINSSHEVSAEASTPTWPTFPPVNVEEGTEDDDAEAGTESDSKSFITAVSPPSPRSPTMPDRTPRSRSPKSTLRVGLRRRRTHSPMPPQANIYIPPTSMSGHLTSVILNKTASLLLGPPVQLVALMLNLARRFADGKLKSETYTYGTQGQPIPCEWCDSDIDGNSSEEDDYGISIGGTPEKNPRRDTPRRRSPRKEDRWALD